MLPQQPLPTLSSFLSPVSCSFVSAALPFPVLLFLSPLLSLFPAALLLPPASLFPSAAPGALLPAVFLLLQLLLPAVFPLLQLLLPAVFPLLQLLLPGLFLPLLFLSQQLMFPELPQLLSLLTVSRQFLPDFQQTAVRCP